MNVTVIDTVTGEKVSSDQTQFKGEGFDAWWWTEGNGGCDCNRMEMFADEIESEMDAQMRKDNPELKEWQSYCYREKRFIVIAVEPMPDGYTLLDFNDGYPEITLTKFGII